MTMSYLSPGFAQEERAPEVSTANFALKFADSGVDCDGICERKCFTCNGLLTFTGEVTGSCNSVCDDSPSLVRVLANTWNLCSFGTRFLPS